MYVPWPPNGVWSARRPVDLAQCGQCVDEGGSAACVLWGTILGYKGGGLLSCEVLFRDFKKGCKV